MIREPIDEDARRLIERPSPFESLDRLREETLGRPFIIDAGTTRNLYFTSDAIQASMRLDDPITLVFAYTRKMMAFLLFRPVPHRVLMLGLGGGSLAKFCYHRLPRTRISVVEISREVIALREEFAIPQDDERFEIIHEDGAAYLARTPPTTDIILIDAFDEDGVAPSLASTEFYQIASRCLAPDELLVMNLSGQKGRYAVHIESLRAAFPVLRLVPVEGEDNLLLFAFRRREWAALPDFLRHRAAHLERALGLEFSRYLERLHGGHLFDCVTSREGSENPTGAPG